LRPYRDINGDSGISAYEYDNDCIKVQFKYGGTYEYRASRIGAAHLSNMKRLADSGDGLNAYINTHPDVKNGYSRKF
jgi:hypothetical protein